MGKMAFRLEIGQISDPITMGARAYSIIKLLEKTQPRQKSFEEAKPLVERQIRVQSGDSLRTTWHKFLEVTYPVNINDKALAAALPLKPAEDDKAKAPGMPPNQPKMPPQPQSMPGTPQQAAKPQGGQ